MERERLQSYADLLAWSEQAGTVPHATGKALREAADSAPRAARMAYRETIRARADLHVLFVALASGQRPAPPVIASLNRRSREAMAHLVLRPVGQQVGVDWDPVIRLDRPLWPVLRAMLGLLTSANVDRLRLCANPECGWVFLDQSRTGNRRWCAMRECGSRAKAQSYYHRRRAGLAARRDSGLIRRR